MNAHCKLFLILAATTLSFTANATLLESLHSNQRWLERKGTAKVEIYNYNGTKLLNTATCEAQLNSALRKSDETLKNDEAYFSVQTFDGCTTKQVAKLSFFDLSVNTRVDGVFFESLMTDLKLLEQGQGTYLNSSSRVSYTFTSTDTSVKVTTRVDEDVMSTVEVSSNDGHITYQMKEYRVGKLARVVTATF